MTLRTVRSLLYAEEVDMGGMPIRQPLPGPRTEDIDPFLLLHHHASEVPANTAPLMAGVGPHPHRGFSPVTFIFKGDVHHRDSRGNSAIVKAGGVQWMNAGMGVIHSERPSAELAQKGGAQEIIQLWINTPAAHKMDPPAYYSLDEQAIPVFIAEDGKVKVKVIAGTFENVKGFDQVQSPLLILEVIMQTGGTCNFPVPPSFNCCLYNMDAPIRVEGFGTVAPLYMAWFKNDGESITLTADGETRVLLLAGEPLNERVVSYGPFVMNDQTQIMQAMRDYQMGKMGVLIEE